SPPKVPFVSQAVSVSPVPTATLSAPTLASICPAGTTDFTVTLTAGTAPMDFSLTNGTDVFNFIGQASPATVTVAPTVSGNFSITALVDASACAPQGPFGSQ